MDIQTGDKIVTTDDTRKLRIKGYLNYSEILSKILDFFSGYICNRRSNLDQVKDRGRFSGNPCLVSMFGFGLARNHLKSSKIVIFAYDES